jgi:hypothetical protein
MWAMRCLLALAIFSCARAAAPPAPQPLENKAADAGAATRLEVGAPRKPCDERMPCEVLAAPLDAWNRVLEAAPLVLAVGETHAQKDVPGVASATKRFTDAFLPTLEGRASDLVLELWVANGACGKQEKKVASQGREVTATQAETNQNEFVSLGNAAVAHKIKPHVLVPPCDEYARILDAGAGDIDAMLSMIARLTARQISELLPRAQGAGKMIVAYGGAMHNDATPREGREAWSFGPAATVATGGKYVELDLIVPELVKDTDAWRAQPWYPHYDARAHAGETLLFTTGPRSFAIVFPRVTP